MAGNTSVKSYSAMDARDDPTEGKLKKGTARRDTVLKILRNGWVNGAVCNGRYTDDYKRDAAQNYQKGVVSTETLIRKVSGEDEDGNQIGTTPKHCWVYLHEDGTQTIIAWWSFQSYEFEIDTRKVRFDFD